MNAKEEMVKLLVKNEKELLAANLIFEDDHFVLPVGFSRDQLNEFWDRFDLEYDEGYGRQYLFGTLWFTDGTWAERGAYDGSEWWEIRVRPLAPGEVIETVA